jgi:hypothetical protein
MRYLMFSIPSGTRLSLGLEQKAELSQLVEAAIVSGSLLARGDLSPARDEAYVVSTAGKVTVTDGPFAESTEVIGGFAVFELPSKEAALDTAKQLLRLAGDDVVTVRPLLD